MRLLDLDDDALFSILSHLHGTDALNIALTCSVAYRLAIPRVAAVIVCKSPDQLRRLHVYLRGHDLQARHVEDFELTSAAFYPLTYDTDEDFSTRIDEHFIQARLVADILLQLIHAKGLHRLVLHQLRPLSQKDPRIISSLLGLDRLTCVTLNMVGDCCIAAMQGASLSNLRTLVLRFHNGSAGVDPLPNREPITYPPLLQLLSFLPKLHSLKLHFFTPDRWLDIRPASVEPLLSSIRQLELEDVTPAALNLVQLCPKLVTLNFQLLRGVRGDIPIPPLSTIRWSPLHHLRIRGLTELVCVSHLLPTIHRVEITGFICLNDAWGPLLGLIASAQLLETFRQVSPVSASMWVLADLRPVSFWDELTINAPRLRVLDLHLSGCALPSACAHWLDIMPRCLGCLQLVSLSIRLPVNIQHQARSVFSSPQERRQGEYAHAALLIVETELLVERVPPAIPTLRIFTLTGARVPTAEEVAMQSREGEPQRMWDESGEIVGDQGLPEPEPDAVEELDWPQPCPYMRVTIRRWRVVHTGEKRELALLTVREAAKVQKYIADADSERIERLHEFHAIFDA